MSQIVILCLRLEKYIVSNEFFNINSEAVYLSLLIVYKPIDCEIICKRGKRSIYLSNEKGTSKLTSFIYYSFNSWVIYSCSCR
jgi:hypothetical protein